MKKYLSSSKLSPIEMAKHLISLKSFTESKSDFDKVKEILVPTEHHDRIEQIIFGLEQEDEFAILCKLMSTCETISKIGQIPLIENEEIAPDFLAAFAPASTIKGLSKDKLGIKYNCFIEVKSCKSDTFKISKKDLEKRRAFANRFHLPLIFAVRFTAFHAHGVWTMVDSNKLLKQGRKIDVSSILKGMKTVLLDDYGLFTDPNMFVAYYYDNTDGVTGIKHNQYGSLVETVFLFPDEDPIHIEQSDMLSANIFLEVFDSKEVIVKSESSITCQIMDFGSQLRIFSDIMFRINHMAIDKNGDQLFDATKVTAHMDSKEGKYPLISREIVERIILLLNSKRRMFYPMGLGNQKDHDRLLNKLRRHSLQ